MARDAGERGRDGDAGERAAPTAGPRVTGADPGPDPDLQDSRDLPHPAQEDGAGTAPGLGRNPEAEESALPPHEPGSMDISHHEATYQSFIRLTIRAVIAIFVVLLLLALING